MSGTCPSLDEGESKVLAAATLPPRTEIPLLIAQDGVWESETAWTSLRRENLSLPTRNETTIPRLSKP